MAGDAARAYITNKYSRQLASQLGFDPDDPDAVDYFQSHGLFMGEQPRTGIVGQAQAFGQSLLKEVGNSLVGLANLPADVVNGVGIGDKPLWNIKPFTPSLTEQLNEEGSGLGQGVGFIAPMFLGAGAASKIGFVSKAAKTAGELAEVEQTAAKAAALSRLATGLSEGNAVRTAFEKGMAGLAEGSAGGETAANVLGQAEAAFRSFGSAEELAEAAKVGKAAMNPARGFFEFNPATVKAAVYRDSIGMGIANFIQPGSLDERFKAGVEGLGQGAGFAILGAQPGMSYTQRVLRTAMAGGAMPLVGGDTDLNSMTKGMGFGAVMEGMMGWHAAKRLPYEIGMDPSRLPADPGKNVGPERLANQGAIPLGEEEAASAARVAALRMNGGRLTPEAQVGVQALLEALDRMPESAATDGARQTIRALSEQVAALAADGKPLTPDLIEKVRQVAALVQRPTPADVQAMIGTPDKPVARVARPDEPVPMDDGLPKQLTFAGIEPSFVDPTTGQPVEPPKPIVGERLVPGVDLVVSRADKSMALDPKAFDGDLVDPLRDAALGPQTPEGLVAHSTEILADTDPNGLTTLINAAAERLGHPIQIVLGTAEPGKMPGGGAAFTVHGRGVIGVDVTEANKHNLAALRTVLTHEVGHVLFDSLPAADQARFEDIALGGHSLEEARQAFAADPRNAGKELPNQLQNPHELFATAIENHLLNPDQFGLTDPNYARALHWALNKLGIFPGGEGSRPSAPTEGLFPAQMEGTLDQLAQGNLWGPPESGVPEGSQSKSGIYTGADLATVPTDKGLPRNAAPKQPARFLLNDVQTLDMMNADEHARLKFLLRCKAEARDPIDAATVDAAIDRLATEVGQRVGDVVSGKRAPRTPKETLVSAMRKITVDGEPVGGAETPETGTPEAKPAKAKAKGKAAKAKEKDEWVVDDKNLPEDLNERFNALRPHLKSDPKKILEPAKSRIDNDSDIGAFKAGTYQVVVDKTRNRLLIRGVKTGKVREVLGEADRQMVSFMNVDGQIEACARVLAADQPLPGMTADETATKFVEWYKGRAEGGYNGLLAKALNDPLERNGVAAEAMRPDWNTFQRTQGGELGAEDVVKRNDKVEQLKAHLGKITKQREALGQPTDPKSVNDALGMTLREIDKLAQERRAANPEGEKDIAKVRAAVVREMSDEEAQEKIKQGWALYKDKNGNWNFPKVHADDALRMETISAATLERATRVVSGDEQIDVSRPGDEGTTGSLFDLVESPTATNPEEALLQKERFDAKVKELVGGLSPEDKMALRAQVAKEQAELELANKAAREASRPMAPAPEGQAPEPAPAPAPEPPPALTGDKDLQNKVGGAKEPRSAGKKGSPSKIDTEAELAKYGQDPAKRQAVVWLANNGVTVGAFDAAVEARKAGRAQFDIEGDLVEKGYGPREAQAAAALACRERPGTSKGGWPKDEPGYVYEQMAQPFRDLWQTLKQTAADRQERKATAPQRSEENKAAWREDTPKVKNLQRHAEALERKLDEAQTNERDADTDAKLAMKRMELAETKARLESERAAKIAEVTKAETEKAAAKASAISSTLAAVQAKIKAMTKLAEDVRKLTDKEVEVRAAAAATNDFKARGKLLAKADAIAKAAEAARQSHAKNLEPLAKLRQKAAGLGAELTDLQREYADRQAVLAGTLEAKRSTENITGRVIAATADDMLNATAEMGKEGMSAKHHALLTEDQQLDHLIMRLTSPEEQEPGTRGLKRRQAAIRRFLIAQDPETVKEKYPALSLYAAGETPNEGLRLLRGMFAKNTDGKVKMQVERTRADAGPAEVRYVKMTWLDGSIHYFSSEEAASVAHDILRAEMREAPNLDPVPIPAEPGAPEVHPRPRFRPKEPVGKDGVDLAEGEGDGGMPVDSAPPDVPTDRLATSWFNNKMQQADIVFAKLARAYPRIGQELHELWQHAKIGARVFREAHGAAMKEMSDLMDRYHIGRDYETGGKLDAVARAADDILYKIQCDDPIDGPAAARAMLDQTYIQLGRDHGLSDNEIDFLRAVQNDWMPRRFAEFGLTAEQCIGYYARFQRMSRGLASAMDPRDPYKADYQRMFARNERMAKVFNPDATGRTAVDEAFRQRFLQELGVTANSQNFFAKVSAYSRAGYRTLHLGSPLNDIEVLMSELHEAHAVAPSADAFIGRMLERAQGVMSREDVLATDRRTRDIAGFAKALKNYTETSWCPEFVVPTLTKFYRTLGIMATEGQVKGLMDYYTVLQRSSIFGLHIGRMARDFTTQNAFMLFPRFQTKHFAQAAAEVLFRPELREELRERALREGALTHDRVPMTDVGQFPAGVERSLDAAGALYRKSDPLTRLIAWRASELAVQDAYKEWKVNGDMKKFAATTGIDTYGSVVRTGLLDEIKGRLEAGDVKGATSLVTQVHQDGSVFNALSLNSPGMYDTATGRFFGQFGSWPISAVNNLWWMVKGPFALHGSAEGGASFAAKRALTIAGKYALAAQAVHAVGAAFDIDTSDWIPFVHNIWYTGGPGLSAVENFRDLFGSDPVTQARFKKDPGAFLASKFRRVVPVPMGGDIWFRRVLGQTLDPSKAQQRLFGLTAMQPEPATRVAVGLGFNPATHPLTKLKTSGLTHMLSAPLRAAEDFTSEATGGILPPSNENMGSWGAPRR